MSKNTVTTTDLLNRWYEGDKFALDTLIKLHLPWIEEYVHKRLGHLLRRVHQTNDMVQEAMLEFLRYGPKIRILDDSHFRLLLRRIVENRLCHENDFYTARRRKLAREQPLPSSTILNIESERMTDDSPTKVVQKNEEKAWVLLALEFLDTKEREILIRRMWDNESYKKIGECYGITKDATCKRIIRALERMKGFIDSLKKGNIPLAMESKTLDEEKP